MHTPPDTPNRSPRREQHRRRMRMTLWIGAWLLIVLGVGWAVFFSLKGAWAIVVMDLVMLAVGITIAVLTHYKRTRMAFFLLVISMFIVICGFCLLLDVPTAQAPRSIHNFLLVLAVAALFFYVTTHLPCGMA